MAEALALQVRAASGAAARAGARMTCAPKSRSGRARVALVRRRPRAGRGRSRPANRSCSRAIASSGSRASAGRWWRRRRSAGRARRRAGDAISCSTANASVGRAPGRWGRRPRGRGRSRRRSTSVGRKWRAANVRLARSRRHRSARPGRVAAARSSSLEHRHLRRRRRPRRPPGRPAGSARRSRVARGDAVAHAANSARVHSKRWSGWRKPAGRSRHRRLYSAFGVVTTTVVSRGEPNTFASTPPGAAGRGAR